MRASKAVGSLKSGKISKKLTPYKRWSGRTLGPLSVEVRNDENLLWEILVEAEEALEVLGVGHRGVQ
jgi:hypothetical protein